MEKTESQNPHVTRFALFLTFSRISLSSFGGALFWTRRGLVERQRWLTEREFVEVLTLGINDAQRIEPIILYTQNGGFLVFARTTG